MIINLGKFGSILTSRQAGAEAFMSLQPQLRNISSNENLEVDFHDVSTLSPSWGDEFLTPLHKQYQNRIILFRSDNLSVQETIKLLEEIHNIKFVIY